MPCRLPATIELLTKVVWLHVVGGDEYQQPKGQENQANPDGWSPDHWSNEA
jgi:hypothetical protein